LAWVALICVLPILESNSIAWSAAACSMLIVFLMSYARSILFDIFQFQGDLIVGSETLPIIFGLRKTVHLLRVVLLSVAIILVWGPFFGLCGPFSYIFLIPLTIFSLCVIAYEKNWISPGLGLEALVECNFLLAGFLGLLWQTFYLKP
jgi:4-hydroxy-3-methylbut-2-enyl diphosphate reductase